MSAALFGEMADLNRQIQEMRSEFTADAQLRSSFAKEAVQAASVSAVVSATAPRLTPMQEASALLRACGQYGGNSQPYVRPSMGVSPLSGFGSAYTPGHNGIYAPSMARKSAVPPLWYPGSSVRAAAPLYTKSGRPIVR